jgi:extracellular factor (EF) 3-hydroxypalmitic acid methyl ester biosynthesis protein
VVRPDATKGGSLRGTSAEVPRAFSARLRRLHARLDDLEHDEDRVNSPSPTAMADLDRLLADLWNAEGSRQPGPARGSPSQRLLRETVGQHFWQSPTIRRCYEKPRGYPGDCWRWPRDCRPSLAAR